MAIQKTEGIVLRRQDLRETSVAVTFLTKDFGKIRGLMKGVRGPRAPHGSSCLETFALDEIVFYERRKGDYYTVSQCDLVDFFFPLRKDVERFAYASYIIELLDSVTAFNDANAAVFQLLRNSLLFMASHASPRRVARIFEIKLLDLLGVMPVFDSCVNCGSANVDGARFSLRHGGMLCSSCLKEDGSSLPILPGAARFISHVKGSPFDKVSRIKVSQKVGEEVEATLRKFLDYHIERRLKTLDFIRAIHG